ncbi:MAG: SDR family oxidoreductase, partial [Cyanobacteria bacterium J06648_11]
VLITGASSGIGKSTAELFQKQGWNVVATMRSPEKAIELARMERVRCLRLDVTSPETIHQAIATAIADFGTIDAAINNAGYALVGPFEASTPEQVRRQLDTNVIGLMNVTRAILPHFRDRGGGVLVNIASVGGRVTFPLYSVYHATKWAVEGFSESLHYELEPFGIAVKLIEPGPIKTDFYDRSMDVMKKPGLTAYDDFGNRAIPNMQKAGTDGVAAEAVAKVIVRATTDGSKKMRYPINTKGMPFLRRFIPDGVFFSLIRRILLT